MTFSITKGDLFEQNFEGYAQGVNTYGIMGAGIAVPFKTRWPDMYQDYKEFCKRWQGYLPGMLHTYTTSTDHVIFNLFSQIAPGKNGDYNLLRQAAFLMRLEAESRYLVDVGMPWIGCGIAGLEKHNVKHILNEVLFDSEVDFVLVEQ